MAYDTELAGRIRAALAGEPTTREVKMFGGLSFMVNDAMVMNVGSTGELLVRVDPDRDAEHLARDGVSTAEMGAGRTMGRGWLAVEAGAVAADEDLAFWIDTVLDFNRRNAARATRRAKTTKAAR